MAMVVMVIVRTAVWMRELIKAYATITNNGRCGQARAPELAVTLVLAGTRTPTPGWQPEQVLPAGLQLISTCTGSHSHLWPLSPRQAAGRARMRHRSARPMW